MSSAPTISIRPNDSDDVKWALQTATTQADRGSLAEAIQWVKRAAQHAEESGDAWRATELQNSARLLAEQMWTSLATPAPPEAAPSYPPPGSANPSSLPVSLDIEDVDADDLLDDNASTVPPRGRFESVPPGVVFRQSMPSDRATPEPFLLSHPHSPPAQPVGYPSQSLPGAPPEPPPAFGHTTAPAGPSQWGVEIPPTTGGTAPGFGPVGPNVGLGTANGSHAPPVFLTKAPTLQFGSPQQAPADYRKPPPPRRKSIRPKPPPRRPGSSPPPSSNPHVFSSAPPADRFSPASGQKHPLPAARAPMGTAPEMHVSELDLEASAEGSMLPPPPSETPLTPEEFSQAMDPAEAHATRRSDLPPGFEIDPELADLFAPEEVVDDSDSLDRMSDIVLDPAEFDNQAFIDDGEQTHVLSPHTVTSLRSAPTGFETPSYPPPAHPASERWPSDRAPSNAAPSSTAPSDQAVAEHAQAFSPSGIPTAPPPGSAGFARQSDPISRHSTAPSAPFRPAPSSPDSDAPISREGSPSARSTPPVLVRRGSAPASAPERSPSSRSPNLFVAPGSAPGAPRSTSSAPPAQPALTEPIVDGIHLEQARGFEDLPEEVQLRLAGQARVEVLNEGEEVSFFGAAIVTSGTVDILPAFSDESGAIAHAGDVVFTSGNLQESIDLRVAAKIDGTRIAVWDPETLKEAIAECPWVEDELKLIADRYLAVCGAALGPLGERLDDTLRATVFQRLDVRTYEPGEVIAEAGKPIPALILLGGGRIEIYDEQDQVSQEIGMGDFLFSQYLLGGSKAPGTAKAGSGGALVLTASRHVAHELMMSVPPLVEVLAG